MPNEITIQVGGPGGQVAVELLLDALVNTLAVLQSLEPKVSANGEPLKWEIIRASMRSPLALTLAPASGEDGPQNQVAEKGEHVIRAALHGLRQIEGAPVPPPHFDEGVLNAARKLVQGVARRQATLKLFAPDEEPVEPTPLTLTHIDEAVRKATRTFADYTTVEGRLEVISTHNGDSLTVWQTLTNNRVECSVTPEQLEQAKLLLRKRVAVSGRARYKHGNPISLQAESIRPLRDASELPQPKDLGKLDITGGLSSEDHVWRMRDAAPWR